MKHLLITTTTVLALGLSVQVNALSLAAQEFKASRLMACAMAQEALGQLSEDEYGEQALNVLDGFEDSERNNIIAKAIGYYDGLMFSIDESDRGAHDLRLRDFVASGTCSGDARRMTVSL
ncbi:MAG: hypothetical protein HKN19_12230 [Halioglobus sp.]|nr:hypothetical protein [Halioglobus sp.]